MSILNIPSTICREFGVPGLGAPHFHEDLLKQIDQLIQVKDIRRVICVLIDGLSLLRLRQWIKTDQLPVWTEWLEEGILLPLTSIVPSTTSSALTSLWTGRSPAEHGVVGYEMWLKEYGIVINTVIHAPMSYKNDYGSLVKAGFRADEFIPFPKLGTHLSQNGVNSHAFQHFSISRSELSKMLLKDTQMHTFNTATDLWINLLQLIESKPNERMYNWVYWGEIDFFSHHYGPNDKRVFAELLNFTYTFQQSFLLPMKRKQKNDTLVILTADHGEIVTNKNPQFELRHHPSLIQRLHIMPTGEHRLAYLYVRPGQAENVKAYIKNTWGENFTIINSRHAVKAGLLGPGIHHPLLSDRTGEFMVVANNDSYLWWAESENSMVGRHGGMSPDEMLVPFIALRL